MNADLQKLIEQYAKEAKSAFQMANPSNADNAEPLNIPEPELPPNAVSNELDFDEVMHENENVNTNEANASIDSGSEQSADVPETPNNLANEEITEELPVITEEETKASPKAFKETPQEMAKEIHKETPKEVLKETPKETTKQTLEELLTEMANEQSKQSMPHKQPQAELKQSKGETARALAEEILSEMAAKTETEAEADSDFDGYIGRRIRSFEQESRNRKS